MSLSTDMKKCFKPFDVVTNTKGWVGFVQEVSINESQERFSERVEYAINWIAPAYGHEAWVEHSELKAHCNLFAEFARAMAEGFGGNDEYVDGILGINYEKPMMPYGDE